MKRKFNNFEKALFDRANTVCKPNLKEIFIHGCLDHRDQKIVGIVGSRQMTLYGQRVISDICKLFANKGVTVVSGLMYGVDLESHKKILEYDGRTIAVLGYGIEHLKDYSYALEVSRKIIEEDRGAIISEFEPGQSAQVWTFPRRNRIVAALSDYLIIIEASANSGTIITADLALEMGKEVFVVPGTIYNEQSYGCNKLLSQGATPLYDLEQLIEVSGFTSTDKTPINQKMPNLDQEARQIYDYLIALYNEKNQKSVDKFELMKNTLPSVNVFNVGLSELELNNLITVEGDIVNLK